MKSGWIGILLVSSALLPSLSGCGFYHEKHPPDPSTVPTGHVGWSQVYAEVLQPRCDLCHSAGGAGFDSSNYDSVVAMLGQVQERALNRQSMPPDSPLTPYESALLSAWINETPSTPYNAP